jgi:hypothetical protein
MNRPEGNGKTESAAFDEWKLYEFRLKNAGIESLCSRD